MNQEQVHLTYCTNIHKGESWEATFDGLKEQLLKVKERVCANGKFGIGLRLSNAASKELTQIKDNLLIFQTWLLENNCYVITINGFPYGQFHDIAVKENVHLPDWATKERVEYTIRLVNIINYLAETTEVSISTSPLSYKFWHTSENLPNIYHETAINLAKVVSEMHKRHMESGIVIHLDLEPEPDGLIENAEEFIKYFEEYLLPVGIHYLIRAIFITKEEAEAAIRQHIRICYDVCHFAVLFEDHQNSIKKLEAAGIKIGKIQLSSALKVFIPDNEAIKIELEHRLSSFADPIYLHQVVEKQTNNIFRRYSDLQLALPHLLAPGASEWRIHYHVPIFQNQFGNLYSTQRDVHEVIDLVSKNKNCNILEVETYTWEVLPEEIKPDIIESITNELKWVMSHLYHYA